jgi:hypothetical protein
MSIRVRQAVHEKSELAFENRLTGHYRQVDFHCQLVFVVSFSAEAEVTFLDKQKSNKKKIHFHPSTSARRRRICRCRE